MQCPHCEASIDGANRFCPSCGHSLEAPENLAEAITRSATGWLTSSGSISHGRFPPGRVLDNRYRIVGLIGRGGMGEVYRADDLRLGQPVALKFLPDGLRRDAKRLAQFHNEVRIARLVSHPNVCRTFDIGESDGQLYLSMEYVDGEDLAALLRRIGRLPEDKVLQIARETCAGLAAAHERGVLHRDLKPANIMLDGSGKVRLMDFGLATAGVGGDVRAGTPAYMAPEQLEGREVTTKSDLYALGLVLYELFTGRRAFDAQTMAELMQQHAAGTIVAPSEIVKTLDARIERAILRCLDETPSRRPASALAVSGSLPGGDPIAAALAAGDTPSPEMVAAAGGIGAAMAPLAAVSWMAALVILLSSVAWLADHHTVAGQSRITKPGAVLAEYGAQVRAAAGYADEPRYTASGFDYDRDALQWYAVHGGPAENWMRLERARPAAVGFWYRTSDRRIDPLRSFWYVSLEDPPATQPGDTTIELDPEGRLLRFAIVPVDGAMENAGLAPPDWQGLFRVAGLDAAAFTQATPVAQPASYADNLVSWTGPASFWPDARVRVNAASLRGRPVWFSVVLPWSAAGRAPESSDRLTWAVGAASLAIQCGLVLLVFRLALTNLRARRADWRAALRIAFVGFSVELVVWMLMPAHSGDPSHELIRVFDGLAWALLYAVTFGAAYLGLEPYVRRSWPRILVGWTRLMRGSWTDPLVGHDVLIGLVCGFVAAAAYYSYHAVPVFLGRPSPPAALSSLLPLTGLAAALSVQASQVNVALMNGLFLAFVMAALKRHVGSLWLVLPVVALGFALTYDPASTIEPAHASLIIFAALPVLVGMLILLRFGLLAWVAAALSGNLTTHVIFTLDPARAYFHSSLLVAGTIVTLGAIAWRLSRGDEPLLAQPDFKRTPRQA